MDPSQTNSADSSFHDRQYEKKEGGGGGGWVGWGGGVGQVSYGKVYLSIGMYC